MIDIESAIWVVESPNVYSIESIERTRNNCAYWNTSSGRASIMRAPIIVERGCLIILCNSSRISVASVLRMYTLDDLWRPKC